MTSMMLTKTIQTAINLLMKRVEVLRNPHSFLPPSFLFFLLFYRDRAKMCSHFLPHHPQTDDTQSGGGGVAAHITIDDDVSGTCGVV